MASKRSRHGKSVLLSFFGGLLLSTILLWPQDARARYRVTPWYTCYQPLAGYYYCPVPTGSEFNPLNVTSIEVDVQNSTSSAETLQYEPCRVSWTGATTTCVSPVSVSVSAFSVKNSVTTAVTGWTGGSQYDYRYIYVIWSDNMLGTFVNNPDT